MIGKWMLGAGMAAMLAVSQAQAADTKQASEFVKCDGAPAHMSGLAATGYLVALTATGCLIGCLIGAPETADKDKKLKGVEGISSCDAALAQETDELRRAQLVLARAIHAIEAKDYPTALTDARRMTNVAGDKAGKDNFQGSMGLAALEIEAAALAGDNRPAEAEATALRMARAAPYDLINIIRARPYVGLTPTMTPDKRWYFDQFGRLMPVSLTWAGEADQWAGENARAAADLAALIDLSQGFITDGQPVSPEYLAQRAVSLMLAGDIEASNRLAAEARAGVDGLVRNGKAVNRQNEIAKSEELLDFQAVGANLAAGKVTEARLSFAGRSRWVAPTAAAVSTLTARLRQGAPEASLIGALARDPEKIRAEALASRLASVVNDPKQADLLFQAIRYQPPSAYNGASGNVWRVEKSRLVLKRRPQDTYAGEALTAAFYLQPDAQGVGLLLHAALRAKAQGDDAFVLSPVRSKLEWMQVRYGKSGAPGFPNLGAWNVEQVVSDLSPLIPAPAQH